MAQTSRRTVAVIVGLVVVLGVVALVAYTAGRSGTATPPPTTPQTPATSAAPTPSPSPSYSPTNQQGSPEPALTTGNVTTAAGGHTTGPDGVPLGYAHDRSGAIAAATNYLMWMNSIRIKNATTAASLAAATTTDAAAKGKLEASFADLRSGMSSLSEDQPEPARGAYAVRSYSATAARIYIWAPEVTKDSAGVTDQVWPIVAIDLTWAQDDWKLDGALISATGGAAADPTDPSGNPTPAEKHSILSRTPADPGEITDTARQTWFEYADAPR
ncbi:cytoskeletal protein RodZ [Friedmanniella endophytica]|uniref:Cytoskeletal protein RodZ n=1 Tax=Microlunatus kandeliicorticis TaxID=1759536 RepID=A0A7W3IPI4_9ACTN|nr:hypothetical protein [Microlunatus kandeliicorticis]MBA8792862.1 cytoskeletal protein RodZ [Microlunatus kandeliicorticis]